MDAEKKTVDVLDAIDGAAKWMRHAPTMAVPLREARAAVAELIEAAQYISRRCTDHEWARFHAALSTIRSTL